MYGIYDMKYYENCIGIFNTVKDVADFFHTSNKTILSTSTRKQLRERRYLIVKVEEI